MDVHWRSGVLRFLLCAFALCLATACGREFYEEKRVGPSQSECAKDRDCDTTSLEICMNGRCVTDPLAVDNDGDRFSEMQGDCDDEDAGVYLGARETCGDGVDQDCDGSDVPCEVFDSDGDGFTPAQGDCDDGDPGVSPARKEICGDGMD